MKFSLLSPVVLSLLTTQSSAFHVPVGQSRRGSDGFLLSAAVMDDLTFSPPDAVGAGIEELACIEAANRMKRVAVPVSRDVSSSGSVGVSYIHWPSQKRNSGNPPLILIHGFDSSGLEFRRLGPLLAAKGIDTYAVDILGWGFTQLDDVDSFSAEAKVGALNSFIQTKLGTDAKFCIAGASLGGGAAIELAAREQENCMGLILIDAQGFVDGIGPMSIMPTPLAKLGVEVLRSVPLRNSANQMSYFDKDTFATDEAQVIGRLHCLRDGWSDAMVSFMQSGGFSPSKKVPTINAPSLVLWGRQDGILDGEEFANKVRGLLVPSTIYRMLLLFDSLYNFSRITCSSWTLFQMPGLFGLKNVVMFRIWRNQNKQLKRFPPSSHQNWMFRTQKVALLEPHHMLLVLELQVFWLCHKWLTCLLLFD